MTNHLKTAKVFKGTSAVTYDLIDAVTNKTTEKVESKISYATFVALYLNEMTDVTNQNQL